jgi:hypothetical protein
MTLMLEGVESPHSTACLLNNNYRLHFTCYHFTYENFLKILRFESHCFQLYRAQLYVIGSRNKWVYCLSVLNGWKCCRYLGISNKVVFQLKHFKYCFYEGAVLWLYFLGWKMSTLIKFSILTILLKLLK